MLRSFICSDALGKFRENQYLHTIKIGYTYFNELECVIICVYKKERRLQENISKKR